MREYYLSIILGQQKGWIAGFLRGLLRGVSWIYGGIVMGLRWAYKHNILKSYDLGRPVISVGNMTWGGVGKTPLVQRLAQECLNFGKNPVVLMRGYMPRGKSSRTSDEAQFLSESFGGKVPVIADKDRVQGALKVPTNYGHDIFILDDGFQHWRVRRDLEIVVIDAMNPFGNGAVIPRGTLREPLAALKNADVCVISKADLGARHVEGIRKTLARFCPQAVIIEAVHQPCGSYDLRTHREVELPAGRPLILVSAIGSPEGFEQTVKKLSCDVKDHIVFPDHHAYGPKDIQGILKVVDREGAAGIVTTAKDSVKLREFLHFIPESVDVVVLKIGIKFLQGEEVLSDVIRSACIH
jgi:tetraacyldisaccharide 4'-kinase